MTSTEPGTPNHQATATETRTVTFTCVAVAFGPPENAITAAEDRIDRRWKALEAQGAVLGPIQTEPTRADLRAAQLAVHPDTTFLDPFGFVQRAHAVLGYDLQHWHARCAQYLYDYPEGQFYACGAGQQCFGFRYGTDASEYISF